MCAWHCAAPFPSPHPASQPPTLRPCPPSSTHLLHRELCAAAGHPEGRAGEKESAESLHALGKRVALASHLECLCSLGAARGVRGGGGCVRA